MPIFRLFCTAQDLTELRAVTRLARFSRGGLSEKAPARARVPAPLPPVRQFWRKTMILTTLIGRLKAYLRYRRSVDALSRLTDRELQDIGIARWRIDQVSRQIANT